MTIISSKVLLVVGVVICTKSIIAVVDAAAGISGTVECLPEASSVCVGEMSFTTPSPASFCDDPNDPNNCTTVYMGGFTYNYVFVEGLDQGTDFYELDEESREDAKTGMVVLVTVDDENECEITIGGNETCAECSTCDGGDDDLSVSFDCTNVEYGRSSSSNSTTGCEPLFPIFYPLEIPESDALTTDDTSEEVVSVTVIGEWDTVSGANTSCSFYEACAGAGLDGECCPTEEGTYLACCSGIEVSPTTVPLYRPENASCSLYETCVEVGLTADVGGEAACCPDDDGEYLACCYGIPNDERSASFPKTAFVPDDSSINAYGSATASGGGATRNPVVTTSGLMVSITIFLATTVIALDRIL